MDFFGQPIFKKVKNSFIHLFFGGTGYSLLLVGFLSCGEQGLLFVAGLLIAVASLVADMGSKGIQASVVAAVQAP